MSKAQYEIYIGKVMDLAKTLVVKSKATAEAINAGLAAVGIPVNEADPASWKYYLNLAGQYHSSDTQMSVTSLDTLQTITFSRDNLQEHQATRREYAYGSRYYNELVSRYPTQEMLIRGILNPVDPTAAIAAEDGEVLWFDPQLVESNETDLIPRLAQWCREFMVRWHVAPYTITDDLYAAGQLAVLYMNIPQVVLNIRLSNCHTNRAHSFHIREFLASNGRLDEYVDNLTKKQMLWLYRNIRYLHRNTGKQETFGQLVEHILTDRGLPLAEWSMRHNLLDQLTEIYPDIEFARKPINFGYSSSGVDTRTVQQLLEVERPVAKGNLRVEAEAEPEITVAMENSLSNQLSTKVLESSVLDLTDASAFTLSDCLLNHWLYLAKEGRYNAVVVVDNPRTGDPLALSTLDAFIVFLYCYNKARGLALPNVPVLEAINVRRDPMPTRTELRGIIDAKLVSAQQVEDAYRDLEPLGTYISIAAFHNAMIRVHDGQLWHRRMYATCEHYRQRGLVEQMVGRFYHDHYCDLAEGVTYAAWFTERGFDFSTFTDLEADLLANALLAEATGANLQVSQSLKDMQLAMLRLMAQLSSYSVQYLQSINSQPVKVVDWPAIRVGDANMLGRDHIRVDQIDVRVQDIDALAHHTEKLTLTEIGPNFTANVRLYNQEKMDLSINYNDRGHNRLRVRMLIPQARILGLRERISQIPTDTTDTTSDQYISRNRLMLVAAFSTLQSPSYTLTATERQTIQNQWQAWVDSQPAIPPIPPETMTFTGLNYPPIPGNDQLQGLDLPPP